MTLDPHLNGVDKALRQDVGDGGVDRADKAGDGEGGEGVYLVLDALDSALECLVLVGSLAEVVCEALDALALCVDGVCVAGHLADGCGELLDVALRGVAGAPRDVRALADLVCDVLLRVPHERRNVVCQLPVRRREELEHLAQRRHERAHRLARDGQPDKVARHRHPDVLEVAQFVHQRQRLCVVVGLQRQHRLLLLLLLLLLPSVLAAAALAAGGTDLTLADSEDKLVDAELGAVEGHDEVVDDGLGVEGHDEVGALVGDDAALGLVLPVLAEDGACLCEEGLYLRNDACVPVDAAEDAGDAADGAEGLRLGKALLCGPDLLLEVADAALDDLDELPLVLLHSVADALVRDELAEAVEHRKHLLGALGNTERPLQLQHHALLDSAHPPVVLQHPRLPEPLGHPQHVVPLREHPVRVLHLVHQALREPRAGPAGNAAAATASSEYGLEGALEVLAGAADVVYLGKARLDSGGLLVRIRDGEVEVGRGLLEPAHDGIEAVDGLRKVVADLEEGVEGDDHDTLAARKLDGLADDVVAHGVDEAPQARRVDVGVLALLDDLGDGAHRVEKLGERRARADGANREGVDKLFDALRDRRHLHEQPDLLQQRPRRHLPHHHKRLQHTLPLRRLQLRLDVPHLRSELAPEARLLRRRVLCGHLLDAGVLRQLLDLRLPPAHTLEHPVPHALQPRVLQRQRPARNNGLHILRRQRLGRRHLQLHALHVHGLPEVAHRQAQLVQPLRHLLQLRFGQLAPVSSPLRHAEEAHHRRHHVAHNGVQRTQLREALGHAHSHHLLAHITASVDGRPHSCPAQHSADAGRLCAATAVLAVAVAATAVLAVAVAVAKHGAAVSSCGCGCRCGRGRGKKAELTCLVEGIEVEKVGRLLLGLALTGGFAGKGVADSLGHYQRRWGLGTRVAEGFKRLCGSLSYRPDFNCYKGLYVPLQVLHGFLSSSSISGSRRRRRRASSCCSCCC